MICVFAYLQSLVSRVIKGILFCGIYLWELIVSYSLFKMSLSSFMYIHLYPFFDIKMELKNW